MSLRWVVTISREKAGQAALDSMLTLRNFEPRQWPPFSCRNIAWTAVKIVPPAAGAPKPLPCPYPYHYRALWTAAVPWDSKERPAKDASSGQAWDGLQHETPMKWQANVYQLLVEVRRAAKAAVPEMVLKWPVKFRGDWWCPLHSCMAFGKSLSNTFLNVKFWLKWS